MTVYGTLKGCVLSCNVGELCINNSFHWKNTIGYFVVQYYDHFRDRDWYNITKVMLVNNLE